MSTHFQQYDLRHYVISTFLKNVIFLKLPLNHLVVGSTQIMPNSVVMRPKFRLQHHTCLTVSQYQTTQELLKKASVGLQILIHVCEYLLRLADSATMSH